jgi:hypothetical protein
MERRGQSRKRIFRLPNAPPRDHLILPKIKENKALVLDSALFNKRDYAADERLWSDRY